MQIDRLGAEIVIGDNQIRLVLHSISGQRGDALELHAAVPEVLVRQHETQRQARCLETIGVQLRRVLELVVDRVVNLGMMGRYTRDKVCTLMVVILSTYRFSVNEERQMYLECRLVRGAVGHNVIAHRVAVVIGHNPRA